MGTLHDWRTRLQESFWFAPGLLVACSFAAAALLVEVDARRDWDLALLSPRLFGAGADGSRAMLAAIATSMITVAGVVFSITMVTLSLAATQYSPRLLRSFMRDRPTQLVLGTFLGVFVYCLVVLRTIRGGDEGAFVPSLAVLGGMAYALAGVAILIYFIHHVAMSIQASAILARIAADTRASIAAVLPQREGGERPARMRVPAAAGSTVAVAATRTGYVTGIDRDALRDWAVQHGTIVRVQVAIGDFVAEGDPLLCVDADDASQAQCEALGGKVHLASQRAGRQDVGYGLQQLAEVALRALSAAVNDPTTACMAIDRLGELLAMCAARPLPTDWDSTDGRHGLCLPAPTLAGWTDQSLVHVVMHARGEPAVLTHVLAAAGRLAGVRCRSADQQAAVRNLLAALLHAIRESAAPAFRPHLEEKARELAAVVEGEPGCEAG